MKRLCLSLNLSAAVGKKFVEKKILDSDLIWLAVMPDERLLSDFGLAAAQSFSLRRFAAENISHNAALALVAERDAIVPRANAAAALHHPPPAPYVPLEPSAPLPLPSLAPSQAPAVPARVQPRAQGGRFGKMRKGEE